MTISVTLPWPPAELSPNFRTRAVRWLARKRKEYKHACAQAAWDRGVRPVDGGTLREVIFHAPDARSRDLDNLIASAKALQDGLAEAMGTDDANFAPDYRFGPVVKGGAVVAILEIPDEGQGGGQSKNEIQRSLAAAHQDTG